MTLRFWILFGIFLTSSAIADAKDLYDFSVLDRPIGRPVSAQIQEKRQTWKIWYAQQVKKSEDENTFSFERLYLKYVDKNLPYDDQLWAIADKARLELTALYPAGTPIEEITKNYNFLEGYRGADCKEITAFVSCKYDMITAIADDHSLYISWTIKLFHSPDNKLENIKVVWDTEAISSSDVPFKK